MKKIIREIRKQSELNAILNDVFMECSQSSRLEKN
jgi:hypothetical protein